MTTLNLQVAASADDAKSVSRTNDQANAPTSGVPTITARLEAGNKDVANEAGSAARFLNVTIAQATTLDSAVFKWTALETYTAAAGSMDMLVSGIDADNPGTFTTDADELRVSVRARTTANTTFDQDTRVLDTEYSSTITAAIQEVVDRAGFASGNAIGVLIDPATTTTDWGIWYAYDDDTAKAPKLDITFTDGAARTRVPVMQPGLLGPI